MKKYDVIVLGAGAAGLMAAIRVGQRGRKVLLIDHLDKVGSKILISGGGRCNFTNREILPERFYTTNPHFCKSALKSYTQFDFVSLVEKHKIPYHEKTLGQLFCDGSAREIVEMLITECSAGKVEILLNCKVQGIKRNNNFFVQTDRDTLETESLILATGGLSIPKMGATGFTYQVADQFRIPQIPTRPALVPFTFDGEELEFMRALSGVSLEIIAYRERESFREDMVFTHRGLSGPVILQISTAWREGQKITLDLMPDLVSEKILLERKKDRPNAELKTILGEFLPQRLAQAFTTRYLSNVPMNTLSNKSLKEIYEKLKKWELTPLGTEGYAKAEVTSGGIDTSALSSKTMEVTKVPGLYIIGEAVDVTGWLGGYNFQWAWSSGWAAGSYA